MKKFLWLLPVVVILLALPLKSQSPPTYFYVVGTVGTDGLVSTIDSNETSCTFTPTKIHCALSWTAPASSPDPVAGYNVYRGTAAGKENLTTPINSTLVTGTTYLDVVATPNPPTALQGVVE